MKTDATLKSDFLMKVVNQAVSSTQLLVKGAVIAMALLFSSTFVLAQTGSSGNDPLIIVKKGIYPGDGVIPAEVQAFLSENSSGQSLGTQGDSDITLGTEDGTPPTIENCPDDQTVECFGDVGHTASELEYTINCGANGIIIIYEPPGILETGSCPGTEYIVTYDVWDGCGENVTCDQTFTIDNPAPEITFCPEGGEISSPDEAVSNEDALQFTFSCPEDPLCSDITVTVDYEEMLDPCLGDMFIYTYTITDACGRSDQCEQVFTIPPPELEIICPSNSATVECSTDIAPTEDDVDIIGLIEGINYNVMISQPSLVSGDADCPGAVYEVTFSVMDDCDRQASCVAEYVISNEGPTITAPPAVEIECAADAVEDVEGVTFTTACELGADVTFTGPDVIEGNGFCVGSVWKYTYTVTDACGRTASADQLVTIVNEGPSIVVPDDADLECGDSTDPANTGMATASDPCEGALDVSFEDAIVSESCPQVIERTWSAMNECGEMVSDVQTITLIDEEAPVFDTACEFDFELLTSEGADCPSEAGFSFEEGDEFPVTEGYSIAGVDIASLNGCVTDNCTADDAIIIRAATITEIGDGCSTVFTVDFEALDECGNVGSGFTCNYTVTDDVAPELLMPEVLEAEATCSEISLEDAQAFADGTLTEEEIEEFLSTVRPQFLSNGLIPLGTEDDCNESDWYEVSINVEISDDCQALATLICTFVAADICGNESEPISSIIRIVDNTAPEITCPADAIVSCDADSSPDSTGEATATDDCGQEVMISFEDGDVTGSCPEVFTRTWTATDACGNSSTCDQLITIVDEEAPVFDLDCQFDFELLTSDGVDCPSDAGFSFEEGDEFPVSESYSIGGVSIPSLLGCVSDNCTADEDIIIRAALITEVGDGCSTTFTVDFEAIDACGNVGDGFSCNYTIIDDVAPELDMPDVTEADVSCSELSVEDAIAFANGTLSPDEEAEFIAEAAALFVELGLIPEGAEDDCNEAEVVEIAIEASIPQEACPTLVELSCIFVAVDACENTSEQETTTISIVDNTAPVITCPADISVSCDQGVSPDLTGMATATDDCGSAEVTYNDEIVEDGCPMVIERTFTATDGCGLTSTCTQEIIVTYDAPTITAPEAVIIECAADAMPDLDGVDFTVACDLEGDLSVAGPILIEGDGECDGSVWEFIYTVTDGCGEMAADTQMVTIENAGPTIEAPADIELICIDDFVGNADDATASASCDFDFALSISDPVLLDGLGSCNLTQYEVTYTVTDDCQRMASDVQIVTCVNDGLLIEETPPNMTVECYADIVPDPWALEYFSPCSSDVFIQVTPPTQLCCEEDCPGAEYSVTYTITNDCGDEEVVEQFFVIDNEGPTIISCGEDEIIESVDDIMVSVDDVIYETACGVECDVAVVSEPEIVDNGCGGVDYIYTYTITDNCGRTATCERIFTIPSDDPTCDLDDDCNSFSTFYADINGNQTTLYSVVFTATEAILTYETEVDFSAHIAFDAVNSVVYLVNDNGSSILAYDPATDTELFELAIGGDINQLYAVVYNPMDQLIYVGDANDDEIYTIDPLGLGDINFFANAPVQGGDLAIQDGALYLANRGNTNLYTVVADDDGVSDGTSEATLVGPTDVSNISGMAQANNATSFIVSIGSSANFTKVNSADASTENVYMAMLDGEIFELASGGDMAAGCANNFGSAPCSYRLYYTHNPEGTSNYSLLQVELDALGNATYTTLLDGIGSSHIGLSNDGSEIYIVGGSNVRTYDVTSGTITNDVNIFNGENDANLSSFPAAVVGPDNQLFIAGAGNNVWLCDPTSGEATNIASGISVNGGDLIFAPTGEDGAEELWIITRNNGTFTRVLDPGNGAFSVDVDEINGAAVLENGNVLLANGDGNSLLIEVSLATLEVEATYDIDLPLFNGDLAGGCTGTDEEVGIVATQGVLSFPSEVFPNPAVDNAIITFEPVENVRTQVELYDMSGRPMVSLFNAEVKSGLEYRVNVNTRAFENGIYIYRITNGSHQVTKKLMIVD